MTEARTGPHEGGEPRPPTALPFVAAVVVVVAVGVLAFVFLRADDDGRLVRPERLVAVDDETVVVTAPDQPACERIERAQYDLDETQIYLELVAVEVEGCEEGGRLVDVEAEIDLGTPVEGRELVPGVGRTKVPCTGTGAAVTCAPDR